MKPTMRNRMLHSVLVAAFSAVVAFGTLSGISGTEGDVRADSVWPATAPSVAIADDSVWPAAPAGKDDSVWA
jgi:hypothetical protein